MFIIIAEGENRSAPIERQALMVLVANGDVEDAQSTALECLSDAGWEELDVREVGLSPALPQTSHPKIAAAWRAAQTGGAAIVVVDGERP